MGNYCSVLPTELSILLENQKPSRWKEMFLFCKKRKPATNLTRLVVTWYTAVGNCYKQWCPLTFTKTRKLSLISRWRRVEMAEKCLRISRLCFHNQSAISRAKNFSYLLMRISMRKATSSRGKKTIFRLLSKHHKNRLNYAHSTKKTNQISVANLPIGLRILQDSV